MSLSDAHHTFSQNYPLSFLSEKELSLLGSLDVLKEKYRFPAIKNDIGYYLNHLVCSHNLKSVYEFGSGYGQSCFWYFVGQGENYISQIFLNEIKDHYEDVFESVSWPKSWKSKINYFKGDAFQNVPEEKSIDLLLIDGHKSDYLNFIDHFSPYLSEKAFVVVDNAFWKGSVVEDGLVTKKSQEAMRNLHKEMSSRLNADFNIHYIPFEDGLLVLSKSRSSSSDTRAI